jgi:hypothetical protein
MSSPRWWKRPFDDPIPFPRGRQIVALQDAGYIIKLSETEHTAAEWQATTEALILVATLGGLGMPDPPSFFIEGPILFQCVSRGPAFARFTTQGD